MDGSLTGSLASDGGSNWRTDPQYYKPLGTCQPVPGNINLSPGWFQQAHDVSTPKLTVQLFC